MATAWSLSCNAKDSGWQFFHFVIFWHRCGPRFAFSDFPFLSQDVTMYATSVFWCHVSQLPSCHLGQDFSYNFLWRLSLQISLGHLHVCTVSDKWPLSGSCVSPSIQWFHHLMSCVTTTFCHSHVGPDISTSVFSCNAPLCPPQLQVCPQSLTSGWFSCVTVPLRKAVGGRQCTAVGLRDRTCLCLPSAC